MSRKICKKKYLNEFVFALLDAIPDLEELATNERVEEVG